MSVDRHIEAVRKAAKMIKNGKAYLDLARANFEEAELVLEIEAQINPDLKYVEDGVSELARELWELKGKAATINEAPLRVYERPSPPAKQYVGSAGACLIL